MAAGGVEDGTTAPEGGAEAMVTQEDVLRFIAARTAEVRTVAFAALADTFDLSPEAACDHLKRLWRDRLLATVEARPRGFQYRLEPGESIRALRFRLAPRGRERLQWYRRQAEGDTGWIPFR